MENQTTERRNPLASRGVLGRLGNARVLRVPRNRKRLSRSRRRLNQGRLTGNRAGEFAAVATG